MCGHDETKRMLENKQEKEKNHLNLIVDFKRSNVCVTFDFMVCNSYFRHLYCIEVRKGVWHWVLCNIKFSNHDSKTKDVMLPPPLLTMGGPFGWVSNKSEMTLKSLYNKV